MALRLRSPAKINLFLNVLGKRPDGFHELETLFERISLCDTITLTAIPSGVQVTSNNRQIPRGPKNLAYRAAKLLQEQLPFKKGVRICIEKKIPVSAGLGGGSSNAATVLLGLNRLWKLGLSRQKLIALGAKLGSDVPFFILEKPFALGTGRGEILKAALAPEKLKIWHCLVKPRFGISTQEAYQSLNAPPLSRLTHPKADVKMTLHSIRKKDKGALSRLLTNSLELVLNKRVRGIFRIKNELLRHGALAALMSGSGSCVFGIFASKKEAGSAARYLKKKNKSWQVFVTSTF